MEELDKFKLAKEKGITYDPITGNTCNKHGKILNRKGGKCEYYKFVVYDEDGKQQNIYAHRFAWWLHNNEIPTIIDHINRDKLDNRLINLRNTTQSRNCMNTDAKGYWKNGNKYQASIMVEGKAMYLGLHNTEEEANEVYLEAKKKYHQW